MVNLICYEVAGSAEKVARNLAEEVEQRQGLKGGYARLIKRANEDLSDLFGTYTANQPSFERGRPMRASKENGQNFSYMVASNKDYKGKSVVIVDPKKVNGIDLEDCLRVRGYPVLSMDVVNVQDKK
jgi:hypothetical protein